MTILVVGASGATGRLLVEQLCNRGPDNLIDVAHFMADLITDDDTWNKWKGQMPVIYNKI